MMNWDDIRIFLAVARHGSVRNAAISLSVNHSTVSRRITSFEEHLKVRLFQRIPSGYLLTSAGEDLLETAKKIEDQVASADSRIMGQDTQMSGNICVSLPTALSTSILMGEFSTFCDLYPEIELEIIHSYELADLNKREADVAIRVTNNPPDSLVGRKVLTMGKALYLSKDLWARINSSESPTEPSWLGWKDTSKEDVEIKTSLFPKAPIRHIINDPDGMYSAVKAGMGISVLSCLFGDSDSSLMRLPPGKTEPLFDVWVLTHRDLRRTLRVKTFMDFTVKALLKSRKLIEG